MRKPETKERQKERRVVDDNGDADADWDRLQHIFLFHFYDSHGIFERFHCFN